jgi:hypothetical protein
MIDKTNFLEPTPEYAKQFEGISPDQIKDWFNLDLIFMSNHYAKDIAKHVEGFYDYFINEYKIGLTMEEVQQHLKEYSEETVHEMMPTLIRGLNALRETEKFK